MSQVENQIVRVQAYIPSEWLPKIIKYMKEKGYYSMSEMVRDLIREKIVESEK